MGDFIKRTVLVTGANRGIGFVIARQLAELGRSVMAGARDLRAGEEAAKSLARSGRDVEPVHIDLSDAATIDAAVEGFGKSGRQIDVLVNNAGMLHEKPILELTDAEIGQSIAVHVTGPLGLIRALAPGMIAKRYGRIVNLSSGWGVIRRRDGRTRFLRRHEGSAEPAYGSALERTPLRRKGERDVSRLGADADGRRKRRSKSGRGSGCRCLAGDIAR